MNAIDTNVLVYACDKTDPFKQGKAIRLIGELTDAVLLWQVACEFVAASRKLSDQGRQGDKRGGQFSHAPTRWGLLRGGVAFSPGIDYA